MGRLNFNCDRQAKNDFTASTFAYITSSCPDWSVSYFEWDSTGTEIPYGDERSYEQSHMDVGMRLTNSSSTHTYVAEIKERTYNSTAYGKEGDKEGWMYNIPKDKYLHNEQEKGNIPLFSNLYKDGVVAIWNMSKVHPDKEVLVKDIKKINIDPHSKKIPQERLQLWNRDATMIKRKRG